MLDVQKSDKGLVPYLSKQKRTTKHIFYDIETLTVNQQSKTPSDLRSLEYIVTVGYIYKDIVNYFFLPSLVDFIKLLMHIDVSCKIELTAHNGNGYDNHFLLRALKELGYKETNMQRDAINVPYEHDSCENGCVEVLRVKRRSSAAMKFMVGGCLIETADTYMKANAALATVGRKLLKAGVIDAEYTKLDDYSYTLYNKQRDYNLFELQTYCHEVYKQLSPRQIQYCRNDVVMMCLYYHHYKQLYPGYDYNKMTLSQNIMGDYDKNKRSTFQLKNIFYTGDISEMSYKQKKNCETYLKYSEYMFGNINLYTYIKSTYSGGLNLYNDRYVAQLINRLMWYIDLNSSYPYTMASEKMPTYLVGYGHNTNLKWMEGNDDHYYIIRMSIDEFNDMVLDIDSELMRCAFVKYLYKGKDDITINSNNLKLFAEFGVDLSRYNCIDYIDFECHPFGSQDVLKEFYRIKQQAKHKNKIDASDVFDIKILDEILDKMDASEEEIYLAKVSMNGLSGLPALRSTYPVYLIGENGELEGHPTGFTNRERNCVFSCFTTSRSFYNLLHPLTTLSGDEIDTYVYYTDTDSIIVDDVIIDKLDLKLDKDNLGSWDVEHKLNKLYIANNKMYCYETIENEIEVKSCGVKKDTFKTNYDRTDINDQYDKRYQGFTWKANKGLMQSAEFDLHMTFEDFVKKYLAIGCKLPNLKHVINKWGTISLYDAVTEIKHPNYRLPRQIMRSAKDGIEQIKREVRTSMLDEDYEDDVYIESAYGSMSINECIGDINDSKRTNNKIDDFINKSRIARYYT